MKFCSNCDNMYYISINDKDSNLLSYYCRNCGHVDDSVQEQDEGTCILNTQLKKSQQKFNHIINEYTKLDPTLPRIYNIPCPNVNCKTNKHASSSISASSTASGSSSSSSSSSSSASSSRSDDSSHSSSAEIKAEVIYMRYDDTNFKYLYICTTCDTVWKTDDAV